MIFPGSYSKPVLMDIVGAADSGWNAACDEGTGPSTGFDCTDGTTVGKSDGGRLYTNPDGSSRLRNSGDANRGF
ncbi:MAG: hypothetical protein GQ565_11355 [Candidatus Aegiribacteria sp.]|nr:hypothetical protein [Candidatus Aegiribacteria sp.]